MEGNGGKRQDILLGDYALEFYYCGENQNEKEMKS